MLDSSTHSLQRLLPRRALAFAAFCSAPFVARSDPIFAIDISEAPREISPLIYGLNDWSRDETTESLGYTLERIGGNRMTGYNWENNFSNAGSDYLHHSDYLLVDELPGAERQEPGAAVRLSVDHARAAGRPSLVTLQLAGYVAADGNGTVSEAQQAPSARWKEARIRKGAPYSLEPDATDEFVYIDEQVNFLIETYGVAEEGGVFAYSMDNEPALWVATHPRLHPEKPTVEEVVAQNAQAAAMVKDLDPSALVFGPALYGWGAYADLQSAPDWPSYSGDYDWFISAYLDEMRKRSEAAEHRLLDVLDLHYYPEVAVVTGIDANGHGVYTRVTDNQSDSEPLAQARLQAPRSLWDDGYVEQSWVTQWSTQGQPINLFPRAFASIAQRYPGTKLSVSEYDFGGRNHYSGGLAQVDALGIFGRDGIFAACFWGEPTGFIAPAFRLFRNFDGEGSAFGDISIGLANPDAERYSGYAALHRETGALHFILINKTADAEQATLHLGPSFGEVVALSGYGFGEASGPEIQNMDTQQVVLGASIAVPLPARSAVHYILEFAPSEDPSASLRLEPLSHDGRFRLTAPTMPGERHQLQSSPNLQSWDDVDAPILGTGQGLDKEVSASAGSRFWRVVPEE